MARVFAIGPVRRLVNIVNAGVLALAGSPRWGGLVRGNIAAISYTGRKSGRTITLPVGYERAGDTVTIRVLMPDQKAWWRNFLGAGAQLAIELDGVERTGHAVARRGDDGAVSVTVDLDGS